MTPAAEQNMVNDSGVGMNGGGELLLGRGVSVKIITYIGFHRKFR